MNPGHKWCFISVFVSYRLVRLKWISNKWCLISVSVPDGLKIWGWNKIWIQAKTEVSCLSQFLIGQFLKLFFDFCFSSWWGASRWVSWLSTCHSPWLRVSPRGRLATSSPLRSSTSSGYKSRDSADLSSWFMWVTPKHTHVICSFIGLISNQFPRSPTLNSSPSYILDQMSCNLGGGSVFPNL